MNMKKYFDLEDLEIYIKRKSKILISLGWSISLSSIIFIIVLIYNSQIVYLCYMIGILFIGQGFRYYGRELKKKINNPILGLSKKKLNELKLYREQVVKNYFNQNKLIAEKLVLMEKLAEKRKFRDAYNLVNKLIKKNPPEPILEYLIKKKNIYKNFI